MGAIPFDLLPRHGAAAMSNDCARAAHGRTNQQPCDRMESSNSPSIEIHAGPATDGLSQQTLALR